MLQTTENNWYKWYYEGTEFFSRRKKGTGEFRTYLTPTCETIGNFKQETIKAVKSTLDVYSDLVHCLFFSGGVDSEMILRAYLEVGYVPEVFVVRYENDYNKADVDMALEVCKCLNVDINIIDMELVKFFENEAVDISELAQIDRPRMLPSLKYMDLVDGLPVIGHSDVRWYKTKEHVWLAQCFEHDIGCDKYIMLKNRPAIYQWFKWTPGLVLSYTKMKWFRDLISNKFPGQPDNNNKILGYSRFYNDMIPREKLTGFESIDNLILEFEDYLLMKNQGFKYRSEHRRSVNQIWTEITGSTYPFNMSP